MSLDVLEHADLLRPGLRVVVRSQEPEARDPVLVHEAVDLGGDGDIERSCGAHRASDDTATCVPPTTRATAGGLPSLLRRAVAATRPSVRPA